MQEGLTDVNKEVQNFSVTERLVHILLHLGAWAASLGIAVAACSGVYFLSINNLEVRTDFAACFWRRIFPHGCLSYTKCKLWSVRY